LRNLSVNVTNKKRSNFNFKDFKSISSRYYNIDDHWLEWFIGLFEGDGCLVFNPKKGFRFEIISTHKPTLQKIKNKFKFGKVSLCTKIDNNLEKWRYSVEDRYSIYLLLLILNGNIVLNHRYNNIVKIIGYFNNYSFKGKPYMWIVRTKFEQVLPTLNDAWFSGFVDAEGHFGCPIERGRKFVSHYISICFEVGQNGEAWFFEYCHNLFGGGILYPNYRNEVTHNRIIFKGSKTGKNNVTLVFSYFDGFPLVTKLRSYNKWRIMHKYLLEKKHLKIDNLPKLLILAKSINRKQ